MLQQVRSRSYSPLGRYLRCRNTDLDTRFPVAQGISPRAAATQADRLVMASSVT